MKYLKTFELVKNKKLAEWLFYSMIEKIKRINNDILDSRVRYITSNSKFGFRIKSKWKPLVEKILKNWSKKAEKTDMVFYYVIDEESKKESFYIEGNIKSPKLKRVKPTKWVYHVTDLKNKEKILKEGLKVKNSDPEKWYLDLYYPNAIFASMEGEDLFANEPDTIIFKINTDLIKNKWWVDLNFYNFEKNILHKNYIMTFEDIPPFVIEVV